MTFSIMYNFFIIINILIHTYIYINYLFSYKLLKLKKIINQFLSKKNLIIIKKYSLKFM